MGEGQLEAYKDIGIEHYQFVAALGERTCDTCGGLDGEVFPVSEAMEGDNYPPMHANCRCTTIMADADLSSCIARDPLTGENYKVDGDMTFGEWKDSLTPEQRAAMDKYVDNSGKGGIIKERRDMTNKPIGNEEDSSNITPKTKDYSEVGSNSFSDISKGKLYQQERTISANDYETAVLYDKNGNELFSVEGNAGEVRFTKEQIEQMKGSILTHNHPNGTVFSPEDVYMLYKGQLAEIRACNIQGVYILRHIGDWDKHIIDYSKLNDEYWKSMNIVGEQYKEVAAKEGKNILEYLRQMEEDGMKRFADKYGFEFLWEDRL